MYAHHAASSALETASSPPWPSVSVASAKDKASCMSPQPASKVLSHPGFPPNSMNREHAAPPYHAAWSVCGGTFFHGRRMKRTKVQRGERTYYLLLG